MKCCDGPGQDWVIDWTVALGKARDFRDWYSRGMVRYHETRVLSEEVDPWAIVHRYYVDVPYITKSTAKDYGAAFDEACRVAGKSWSPGFVKAARRLFLAAHLWRGAIPIDRCDRAAKSTLAMLADPRDGSVVEAQIRRLRDALASVGRDWARQSTAARERASIGGSGIGRPKPRR